MFMGLLHHRMHQINSGLGNSNAVERLLKTKPGLEVHQMPPMKKCVTKYEIWCTLIGELRWEK